AVLDPEETTAFGDCKSKIGPFSILLLESEIHFDEKTKRITFDPKSTRLINIGSTNKIFLLSDSPSKRKAFVATAPKPKQKPVKAGQISEKKPPAKDTGYKLSQVIPPGDKLFLIELPPDIRSFGELLLTRVRHHFKGELHYEPRTGKFDETPDIFWTVKIQPHNHSLKITVRGAPDIFKVPPKINLFRDKFGYSAFEISNKIQIDGAVSLIKQASKI
ncbi:MAG: hypothetical protein QNK40_09405, partial [Desulfobacterales bacterium]|nr:hypothetical protein [Desulfobacterales bacterium]MDX2509339.1 hypothetical protein [Desulfobacterales bacterium]